MNEFLWEETKSNNVRGCVSVITHVKKVLVQLLVTSESEMFRMSGRVVGLFGMNKLVKLIIYMKKSFSGCGWVLTQDFY